MPSYKLVAEIEYEASRDDSGDFTNEIIEAIENIPFVRSVTCLEEASEVMRFAGDDRPET